MKTTFIGSHPQNIKSGISEQSHDLTWLLMVLMSESLRLMELHLNHTLVRAKVLAEYGLGVIGMNFPDFHGLTVFLIQD